MISDSDNQLLGTVRAVMQRRVNRLQRALAASQGERLVAESALQTAQTALETTQFRCREERTDLLSDTMRQPATQRVLDHYQKRNAELQAKVQTSIASVDASHASHQEACRSCEVAEQNLQQGLVRQEKWNALQKWLDGESL